MSEPSEPRDSKEPWEEYYEQHQARAPRPDLMSVVDRIKSETGSLDTCRALEIGAGSMIEAKYLLDSGFGRVDTYDKAKAAEGKAMSLALDYNDYTQDSERFTFNRVANEELASVLPSEAYDLVASYFTLQFTEPDKFPALWQGILDCVKTGGKISVNLLGNNDSWNGTYQKMTFLSREKVDEMVSGLDDVEISEREYDDLESSGAEKHWHVYSITATKPAPDVHQDL